MIVTKQARKGDGFYRAFASGGSHSLVFCYITMLFVPGYALQITIIRAAQYHDKVVVAPLAWQEGLVLAMLTILSIMSSVLAGAGLKTWMKTWTSLWPSAILQGLIMLQFLLATLELRYFAQNADKLPSSASVPPIAAMTVWVFLVGYLAKIPWDKLVELVSKKIDAASAKDDRTSSSPPEQIPKPR